MKKTTFAGAALVVFFFAGTAHADTRIVQQLGYDGVEAAQTTRWGQSFVAPVSGNVGSVAGALSVSCGTVEIGTLVAGEFVQTGTDYTVDTAISGGRRYSGGSATLTAGSTYWILWGNGAGASCTASDRLRNASVLNTFSGTAAQATRAISGNFVFAPFAFDMVFAVCSDTTCGLNSVPGSGGIDWNLLYFPPPFSTSSVAIATSSSLWGAYTGSTTLDALADQCSLTSNIFSEGLCTAFAFLLVPNPSITNSYLALASTTLPTKFPFSWYYGLKGTYDALTASSTPNMASVVIDFAAVDPATTTPFGPILPTATVLSSTTISTYLSPALLSLLLNLETAAIWVLFGLFIFHDVQRNWLKT